MSRVMFAPRVNDTQRQANADHFADHFRLVAQNGFYMWADKGHKYHRKGERMVAETMGAWSDIKSITPKGWAKKNIYLHVKPKVLRPCERVRSPEEMESRRLSAVERRAKKAAYLESLK